MTTPLFIRSAFLIFMVPAIAMAIEEPEYQVVGQYDNYELREYAPYIIAEVDVQGDFDEAGRDAFRILAGYIFGDNAAAEKMAMTAPVESRPSAKGEKMSMTAPVTAIAAGDDGRTTYAFVMERKFSLQTLPVPNDDRIRIRAVPERTMAVRRYSGRWTEDKYLQNEKSLLSALDADDIQTIGRPVLARYNSPFSLPFMRRNEVMIEIMSGSAQGVFE
jgi:hypothetical protein